MTTKKPTEQTPLQESENPLEEYVGTINTAINNWKAEQTPEHIQKQVIDSLEIKKKEILLKLLGFDKDSWRGEFNLDHCNGRSGNSIAGDYLKTAHQDAIQKWLDNIPLPELTAKEMKTISDNFKQEYVRLMHRRLREIVEQKADLDARALLDALIPPPDVSGIIAAQKFLTS